jgi:hypothetical protein
MRRSQDRSLPFLLGFLNFAYFNSIGQLILVEIIAVFLFLIFKVLFISKSKIVLNKETRNIFILGILWLLGVLLSDLNANSAKIDTGKSIAQILVLLVLLYWVFTWLIENTDRITFYILGYCLSSLPRYFLLPAIFDHSDPWKFVFGPNITLLLFLLLSRLKLSQIVNFCLITGLVIIHLFLGSRSLAIITLLTLFTYRTAPFTKEKFIGSFTLAVVAIFSLFSFNYVYGNLAIKGVLGQAQQIKYSQQSQTGPILLSGRSELLYELGGISETRILGLGSNAFLTNRILEKVVKEEYQFGVVHNSTTSYMGYNADGKIPNHSMIFTAWLEAGILAALFWLYILFFVVRQFSSVATKSQPFGLISKYLSINFFWALFFSPLGAGSRVILAFSLGIVFFQSRLQDK